MEIVPNLPVTCPPFQHGGQSAPDANTLPMFIPRSQKVEGAMQILPNLTVTPSWFMETASANTPLFPR